MRINGGYRTIIAFHSGRRAFFLHGFARKDRDNIDRQDLTALHEFADALMEQTDDWLGTMATRGALEEIGDDDAGTQ